MNIWVTVVKLLRAGYRLQFSPVSPDHADKFGVCLMNSRGQWYMGWGHSLSDAIMEAVFREAAQRDNDQEQPASQDQPNSDGCWLKDDLYVDLMTKLVQDDHTFLSVPPVFRLLESTGHVRISNAVNMFGSCTGEFKINATEKGEKLLNALNEKTA